MTQERKEMICKKLCPKCKGNDLVLTELWINHMIEWRCDSGKIDDLRNGNINPGDPYKVIGLCVRCGHSWTFKGAKQIYDILTPTTKTE